ncbi:hypothetical protein LQK39_001996 [Vibrio vulnificus]|uniref:hypothetical protein n=1 Tax=Vibrio parahaemolyticus TaxID=670 RepID=UPI0011238817|nr:hypothetical protein [Vibrio parahaemolyticus]EIO3974208.1 hypothetical protein [Vibrio vulnificus]EIO3996480.1 hypothetical protein [Vibrio vulnificus]TNZ04124.1 hypothetical protein CGK55_23475 [Vibrio parahaemolyticus]
METRKERFDRLQLAFNLVAHHDTELSFSDLIEPNRDTFDGFKLIYSTNHLEGDFANMSLKSIEDECSTLKKYFYGSGLLFFSDELYDRTWNEGQIKLPIDYSLSLDSNAAERFRIWEDGKDLDKSEQDFENLVRFIKEGADSGFNFDYSFFIIENYYDSMKPENHRPFNTIRALKRFDNLVYEKESFCIKNPIFNESRALAGQRTIDTLYAFHSSPEIKGFQQRRMLLYVVLLKAVLLNQNKTASIESKLGELIEFCILGLEKFPKTELYYAWKLIKYGNSLRFFDPVSQIGKKTKGKLRGMSWDIFALRYQETMASKSYEGDFFVPFFASFDNRFVELTKACPIRAVLIDEVGENVITIQLDELEFQTELINSMSAEMLAELNDSTKKLARMKKPLTEEKLIAVGNKLEDQLEQYC